MDSRTQKARKQALIREIAASRIALGDRVAVWRHKLDVPARAKEAVRRQPTKWVGGSLAAGLASVFLLKRHRKKKQARRQLRQQALQRRPFGALVVAGLASVAKAAVRAFVLEHVVKYVAPLAASKRPRF